MFTEENDDGNTAPGQSKQYGQTVARPQKAMAHTCYYLMEPLLHLWKWRKLPKIT